jgi:hypothetical protein
MPLYQCEVCGKPYKSRSGLKAHRKTHQAIKGQAKMDLKAKPIEEPALGEGENFIAPSDSDDMTLAEIIEADKSFKQRIQRLVEMIDPTHNKEHDARLLDDAGNATWSTAEIDRAIKRALVDYSYVRPQELVDTIELAADGREIDVSGLEGLTAVVRVWYPYTAANPEDPPAWRRFELWASTLYILDGPEPDTDEVVRVYYHAPQTIEDLDAADATTVPPDEEEVIVVGAAAYAALPKARSAVMEAGISTDTPKHWLDWGNARMGEFRITLREIQKRAARRLDKRVPMHRAGWTRKDTREDI